MEKEKFFKELWNAVDQNFETIDEYEDFEDVEDRYFDIIVRTYESQGEMDYQGIDVYFFVRATSNDGGYKRVTSADIEVLGENEEFDKWLDQFNAVEELDKISYNKKIN